MERAGFPSKDLSYLKELGMNWNFYLAHNMGNPVFNPNGVSTILRDCRHASIWTRSPHRSGRCVRQLILRWPLHMVQHVHTHRSFVGLELDPKLLLQRLLKGWAGYIGRWIGAWNR
jgi:hypothetical protein